MLELPETALGPGQLPFARLTAWVWGLLISRRVKLGERTVSINLRSYPSVCFDCDSTLSTLEGIDELAKAKGLEEAVAPLTAAAMDGRMTIEAVYARRLDLIRPDHATLDWLGRRYIETVVPGAKEAIAALHRNGREVFVVSGGLLQPVAALAANLGIAADHVHAVAVTLDKDGRYLGFDETSPLTRSNGKAEVARAIAKRHGPVVLIGDGMTDVAAKAGGAYVIGFGGVARRPAVVAAADRFVDGPSLLAVAALLDG